MRTRATYSPSISSDWRIEGIARYYDSCSSERAAPEVTRGRRQPCGVQRSGRRRVLFVAQSPAVVLSVWGRRGRHSVSRRSGRHRRSPPAYVHRPCAMNATSTIVSCAGPYSRCLQRWPRQDHAVSGQETMFIALTHAFSHACPCVLFPEHVGFYVFRQRPKPLMVLEGSQDCHSEALPLISVH